MYDPEVNIICGDALGITCGTWIAFWNGAIGAFVAAVIGGLVALMVVQVTNAQHRKHAQHAREIEAIANCVAELGAVYNVLKAEEFNEREMTARLLAATVRLRLASPDMSELYQLLAFWPTTLVHLAVLQQAATRKKIKLETDVSRKITEAYISALDILPEWQARNSKSRRESIERLSKITDGLEEALMAADKQVNPEGPIISAERPRS